jgi:hypothetical protein
MNDHESIIQINAGDAKGLCFKQAHDHLMSLVDSGQADDCCLVHGIVSRNSRDGQVVHAWVELKSTHEVIDVTNCKCIRFERQKYYETYGVKREVPYSCDEAIRMQIRSGHYGPWDASFEKML